jgi:hypothetical protein
MFFQATKDFLTLPEMLHVREQPQPPMTVWNNVIEDYRHFRQGKNVGRNPGQERPGRSRGTEPDCFFISTLNNPHRNAEFMQMFFEFRNRR